MKAPTCCQWGLCGTIENKNNANGIQHTKEREMDRL